MGLHNVIVTTPAIGAAVAGEELFGEGQPVVISYDLIDASNLGQPINQFGPRQIGLRQHNNPFYLPISVPIGATAGVALEISTAKGAFLGVIRTDVRQSMLIDLQFSIDAKGCADGVMNLNSLPSFPIPPYSQVTIRVKGDPNPWYKGQIDYYDLRSLKSSAGSGKYSFKLFGLRRVLDKKNAEQVYSAPKDVGLVVDDLAKNWIAPYTFIKYDSSKINTSTGVVTSTDLDFSKAPISKILDTLAKMASCDWGVDGAGALFFQSKITTVQKVYMVGYKIQSFEPKLNVPDAVNSWLIKRQMGMGEGGGGWAVAYLANALPEQAKWGIIDGELQVPGTMGDPEYAILGEAVLAETKTPKYSADVKKIPITSSGDYVPRGVNRFILPPGRYPVVISDMEDAAEFTKFGSGDLAVSTDSTNMISGAAAIKLAYTSAQNDYATMDLSYKGDPKKLLLWVKGSNVGVTATIGIGSSAWDDHKKAVEIKVANVAFPFLWDLEADGLSLTQINKFGIRIEDTGAGTIYIDELSVEQTGHLWYDLDFARAQYKFTPKESTIDAEFGPIPPKTEHFVAAALSAAEELKFVSEVR